MTMQEVLLQLTSRQGVDLGQATVTLWFTLPDAVHYLWLRNGMKAIDIGLYQSGTGEYQGTLLPVFELTLTAELWQPAAIRWSLVFWDDAGAVVELDAFAQRCADYLVAQGWLTQAQLMPQEVVR